MVTPKVLCRAGLAALSIACMVAGAPPAMAEDARILALRTGQRTSFSDAEITEGFLKTAIGAELLTSGNADRIRKFDGPVRVFIDNRAKPDRRAQTAVVVKDIGAHIRNLDIAMTDDATAANMRVMLLRDNDFAKTITAFYGRARARRIERSLQPQCLSGFAKDEAFHVTHSEVFLVVDAGDFIFYDCAYEELLQALGPINDTDTVPWTMFNDKVQKGFFDVYDQMILNILYDRRIRAGMTRDEARAALPAIIPDVRAFVERLNGLRSD